MIQVGVFEAQDRETAEAGGGDELGDERSKAFVAVEGAKVLREERTDGRTLDARQRFPGDVCTVGGQGVGEEGHRKGSAYGEVEACDDDGGGGGALKERRERET